MPHTAQTRFGVCSRHHLGLLPAYQIPEPMEQQALQRLHVLTQQLALVSVSPGCCGASCSGAKSPCMLIPLLLLLLLLFSQTGQWTSRAQASGDYFNTCRLYSIRVQQHMLNSMHPPTIHSLTAAAAAADSHATLIYTRAATCRTALPETQQLTRGATPPWMMWSSLQPCARP